jgi:4-alpha-glucanotransferase
MHLAWSSPAALAIAPLQDLRNLGAEARMNLPGRASGNWRWRLQEENLSLPPFEWLHDLTENAKRSGPGIGSQQIEFESAAIQGKTA